MYNLANKDLFVFLLFFTCVWFFLEILNIITRIWFKYAKKNMAHGIIKEIIYNKPFGYDYNYKTVIVKYKNEDIVAHCWYPNINEEVILKKNLIFSFSSSTYYSCHSEERYLKKSPLRVIITTFRLSIPFIWICYFLFPNFLTEVFMFILYLGD